MKISFYLKSISLCLCTLLTIQTLAQSAPAHPSTYTLRTQTETLAAPPSPAEITEAITQIENKAALHAFTASKTEIPNNASKRDTSETETPNSTPKSKTEKKQTDWNKRILAFIHFYGPIFPMMMLMIAIVGVGRSVYLSSGNGLFSIDVLYQLVAWAIAIGAYWQFITYQKRATNDPSFEITFTNLLVLPILLSHLIFGESNIIWFSIGMALGTLVFGLIPTTLFLNGLKVVDFHIELKETNQKNWSHLYWPIAVFGSTLLIVLALVSGLIGWPLTMLILSAVLMQTYLYQLIRTSDLQESTHDGMGPIPAALVAFEKALFTYVPAVLILQVLFFDHWVISTFFTIGLPVFFANMISYNLKTQLEKSNQSEEVIDRAVNIDMVRIFWGIFISTTIISIVSLIIAKPIVYFFPSSVIPFPFWEALTITYGIQAVLSAGVANFLPQKNTLDRDLYDAALPPAMVDSLVDFIGETTQAEEALAAFDAGGTTQEKLVKPIQPNRTLPQEISSVIPLSFLSAA